MKDEWTLLKSVSIKLDDTTVMIVTYQYHTEPNSLGKVDRSKTRYRHLARVFKIADGHNLANSLFDDNQRLNRYKIPEDPTDYYFCIGNGNNTEIAKWILRKIKKAKPWDEGIKLLNGWKNATEKQEAGYNDNAKYATEGYLDSEGNVHSILDKEDMFKMIGRTLVVDKAPSVKKCKSSIA